MIRVLWCAVAVVALAFASQLSVVSAAETAPRASGTDIANDLQVIIRARLIEVDRSKLRELGIDYAEYSCFMSAKEKKSDDKLFPFESTVATFCVSDSKLFCGFLDALCQNEVARILADPSVTTFDGRPAHLEIGSRQELGGRQEASDDRNSKFMGTKMRVTPELVGDGRVRIDLYLSVSSLAETMQVGEGTVPKIYRQEVATEFEVNLDETFVTHGLTRKTHVGDQTRELELVMLVTPSLVNAQLAK